MKPLDEMSNDELLNLAKDREAELYKRMNISNVMDALEPLNDKMVLREVLCEAIRSNDNATVGAFVIGAVSRYFREMAAIPPEKPPAIEDSPVFFKRQAD